MVEDIAGSASALDTTALIITQTGAYGDVLVGDKVLIHIGENDATDSVTPGIYTVTARTDNAITLDRVAGTTGGTMQVSHSIYRGDPLVLAYLYDGEESGLTEWVAPINAAAAQTMVGGVSFIGVTSTLAADSTAVLADGVGEGMKKGFFGMGALTTGNYVITVTSGLQADGSTALATITMDGVADATIVKFEGSVGLAAIGAWCEVFNFGSVLA